MLWFCLKFLELCICSSPTELTSVGGSHWKHVTTGWPENQTQASGDSSPLPLSLECAFYPPFPWLELFLGCRLERERCRWDHLDSTCDWASLRPLCKLLRFWRSGVEIYLSCGVHTNFLCKFPCLLHLPPANLDGRPLWVVFHSPPSTVASL